MRSFSAKLAIPDSSAPVFMISNRSRNECRNVDKLFQEKDCRFYIHICLLLFLMDYDSFGGGLAFLWGGWLECTFCIMVYPALPLEVTSPRLVLTNFMYDISS